MGTLVLLPVPPLPRSLVLLPVRRRLRERVRPRLLRLPLVPANPRPVHQRRRRLNKIKWEPPSHRPRCPSMRSLSPSSSPLSASFNLLILTFTHLTSSRTIIAILSSLISPPLPPHPISNRTPLGLSELPHARSLQHSHSLFNSSIQFTQLIHLAIRLA
jgi:hypothetical protein